MVMTMSAARTFSSVSRLGNSRVMSMPISAMAWTTAGLSAEAGCDPAEVTRTRPEAWCSSRAAAICDLPALCVQTNSTSGMSAMRMPFCAGPGGFAWRLRMVGWIRSDTGEGDLPRRCRGHAGIQRPDDAGGQDAAGDLRGDERRDGSGRDACEGGGEHAADGDGRIGEAGRGGEEVGGADVGAHRGGGSLGAAGPG